MILTTPSEKKKTLGILPTTRTNPNTKKTQTNPPTTQPSLLLELRGRRGERQKEDGPSVDLGDYFRYDRSKGSYGSKSFYKRLMGTPRVHKNREIIGTPQIAGFG